MKKIISFLFVIMFVFSLSACDIEKNDSALSSDCSSIEDDITARVLAEYPDAEITKITEKEDGSVSVTYRVGDRIEVMTMYADGSVGISGPDLFEENFPSYDEIQEEYPDKTVLVWAIAETLYESSTPFHTRKVNEYLDELGCEFAVCFDPVKRYEYTTEMYPDQMLTEIKKRLDAGEHIDIISPMNYDEFVLDDLYEPLDKYMETDIGRELYRAFPEKLWESLRINGGIYGLSGDFTNVLNLDRGYYVNAKLAEKYGYDVNKPILEQLDILKAVKENENNVDVFTAYSNIDSIVSFTNVKMLSSAVYWDCDTHSAKLSIDNPQYIEWLRLYDTLKREGMLNDMGRKTSDSFFIMTDTAFGGGIGYADMKLVEVDYFGNAVTAIPVFTPHSALRTAPWATGICSKSEHKEEAFKLLARIFTDPVLNDLLVYGVEGENYTLENGVAKEIASNTDGFGINPFNSRFANQMICHRSKENLFTPEQYNTIFDKAEICEDIDFALDPKNIINELNAVYIAADNISLPKDDQTLDEVLAEYREGLYAAGVQKIIDECNRQYEVYKNEKN